MANKYMKKYSISFFIKKMQIKTKLIFSLTLVRMAIGKKKIVGEGARTKKSLTLC
jgi:hypothetical protein